MLGGGTGSAAGRARPSSPRAAAVPAATVAAPRHTFVGSGGRPARREPTRPPTPSLPVNGGGAGRAGGGGSETSELRRLLRKVKLSWRAEPVAGRAGAGPGRGWSPRVERGANLVATHPLLSLRPQEIIILWESVWFSENPWGGAQERAWRKMVKTKSVRARRPS